MFSMKEKQELSDFTEEFGDKLDGPYVWKQLHLDNNEVTFYRSGTNPSCFSIYTLGIDEEKKEIILDLKAICSSPRSSKGGIVSDNLLHYCFNRLRLRRGKSDGDWALFDLEYRMRTILNSKEFRDYTGRIKLEAINEEYVVAFYVKNGYSFDPPRCNTDDSLLPMKKKFI